MSAALFLWPGLLALACALLAVTRANVVHGLMWLVAALVALAATFFGFGAGFAGAVQILIYAGAILAVFVFVVMTVDSSPGAMARERRKLGGAWRLPALMALLVLAPLLAGFHGAAPGAGGGGAVPVQALGAMLFGPWSVAIEAAGFLLLAALLGARCLSRREPPARGPTQ